jgi:hypothetical protein
MITEQQIFEAHERVERAITEMRNAEYALRELRQKEREQTERQIAEAKANKCRENAEAVGPQIPRWI